MSDEYEIVEGPVYDLGVHGLKFVVFDGEQYFSCSVSQMALNDFYESEDTVDAAMGNFIMNENHFLDIAVGLIEGGQVDGEGLNRITSKIIY